MVGRVTYDYQTKYMIDLNMGYNGSENFAKGKRFGFSLLLLSAGSSPLKILGAYPQGGFLS